jgi:exosortase E/protease (VPEID-CTERM system)
VVEEIGTGLAGVSPSASSYALVSGSKARPHNRWIERLISLLLLLAAELTLLTAPFDAAKYLNAGSSWLSLLSKAQDAVRAVFITSLLAMLFFTRPVIADEFRKVAEISGGDRRVWLPWLAIHLILVSLLAVGTALRGAVLPASAIGAEGWWVLWAALAFGSLTSWSLALLPARFWVGWISRSRLALAGSVALAWTAYLLGNCSQFLWISLQRSTFEMVVLLLESVGFRHLIIDTKTFVIGTSGFTVRISPQCSGFEGIGLICAVLGAYCWLYRRELRFPAALFLLPIGIVGVWLLNSVRIAALILIGDANAVAAVKGFHSVAGWLFFNLTACGLIWASSRSGFFSKTNAVTAGRPSAAAPYLMPLIVIIATSMVSRALSDGFDILYPTRVLAAGVALWCYRDKLVFLRQSPSLVAILAGLLAFGLWIALASNQAATSYGLPAMPRFEASLWLTFRTIGSVITVPIVEELAFRGFLLRKLVDSDFESVSFRQFTWFSFLGSSILFGILHGEWIAGIGAGMIFAAVLYRRGQLADAVGAHMTSNALLSAYVLLSHNWSLWG